MLSKVKKIRFIIKERKKLGEGGWIQTVMKKGKNYMEETHNIQVKQCWAELITHAHLHRMALLDRSQLPVNYS